LENKEIAVGDSTRLEIIFSTKKYNKQMTKSPRIQTNEGPPDKRVQIITNVVARPDSTYPLILKPYKLDLTQFGEKVRDEIEFKMTNISDEDIKIDMVSTYFELFDVELPESIGPGETKTCKLKLNPDALDKKFEKSFTFKLLDQNLSRYTVPVKRSIRGVGKTANKAGKGK
jgi:hypothetical protein